MKFIRRVNGSLMADIKVTHTICLSDLVYAGVLIMRESSWKDGSKLTKKILKDKVCNEIKMVCPKCHARIDNLRMDTNRNGR